MFISTKREQLKCLFLNRGYMYASVGVVSLYVHVSCLRSRNGAQDMKKKDKTPTELLREELKNLGHGAMSELGRKLGSRAPHAYVTDILKGRKEFDANPDLQMRVALALGKPRNFFGDPEEQQLRERHIAETFAKFMQTEIGAELDEDTRETIRRMPFLGERLPTVPLYQQIALLLKGAITLDEAAAAREFNEALDRELELPEPPEPQKPGRRKRR